jgi:hypothetical protein
MMWNWKLVYEDETCAFYCDLDKIVDTAGDEDGLYASTECYMPLPERCAIWTSLAFKKKTTKKRYVKERKKTGFPVTGYEDYQYSLCLVEFDTQKVQYRIIPAADYDGSDCQIGDSTLFGNNYPPLIEGVSGSWASIRSKKTQPMIKALYKMFSAQRLYQF